MVNFNIYKEAKGLILKKKEKEAKKLISQKRENDKSRKESGYALAVEGLIEFSYNNFAQALNYFLKSLKKAKYIKNNTFKSEIYSQISKCYDSLCNFKEAEEYINKAVKLTPYKTEILNQAAGTYSNQKKFDKALKYYNKCITLIEKEIDTGLSLSVPYLNIGNIYYNQNKKDLAKEYLFKALSYSDKDNDVKLKSRIFFAMALIFHDNQDFEGAIKKLRKAYQFTIQANDRIFQMRVIYRLSDFLREDKQYEEAIDFLKNYIKLFGETFNKNTTSTIARLHAKLKQGKKEKEEKEKEFILEKEKAQKELQRLRDAYADVIGVGRVGVFSDKMRNLLNMAEFFHKDRSVPVLLEGDTGTGKEIIARIIHYRKGKFKGPFVVLNCSAVTPSLFESELFGYGENAFTGAKKQGKMGKLEMAQGGTIFLDEIGELPLDIQPKLLRVIQHREFYRVGGNKKIKLDVRIICATNRDLKSEVDEGNFRSDLYYRIHTGYMHIPSLKERKEEIGPLAQMFLIKFSKEKQREFRYINKKALEIMENYDWPGNVRELQNTIERIVLLYNEIELKPKHLNALNEDYSTRTEDEDNNHFKIFLPDGNFSMKDLQKEFLEFVLKKFKGNKSKAADYLGISRTTFYRKNIK